MIKLCLIGKNIQHSLSPKIYKELLDSEHIYELLDFEEEDKIPSVKELFQIYNGINITSPYKQHFISQLDISPESMPINIIKKLDDKFIGENTDYRALKDIIPEIVVTREIENIILLGDGQMAYITKKVLEENKMKYIQLSRKERSLSSLDLMSFSSNDNYLVINSCSRQYSIHRDFPPNVIFFDYNYDNPNMNTVRLKMKDRYIDGVDLLKRQALYALEFWNF